MVWTKNSLSKDIVHLEFSNYIYDVPYEVANRLEGNMKTPNQRSILQLSKINRIINISLLCDPL